MLLFVPRDDRSPGGLVVSLLKAQARIGTPCPGGITRVGEEVALQTLALAVVKAVRSAAGRAAASVPIGRLNGALLSSGPTCACPVVCHENAY
jgi:hypothetical protein